jgi:membrane-associated phospholipid phosphatase
MMLPQSPTVLPFWKFGLFLVLIAGLMIAVQFLQQLDFIAWLQSTGSTIEVRALQFVSDSITFFSLGVPLIIGIIGEFKDEKKKSRLSFLYVGLSIGLAGLISYAIKNIGLVPRPYEVDSRITQWSVGGGFSFPSGHTTEAFAAATALTFLFPRWRIALVFFFWASLVAFSRIYLGVHYPFDVLGGIAIGTTSAYALQLLFRKKTKLFNLLT